MTSEREARGRERGEQREGEIERDDPFHISHLEREVERERGKLVVVLVAETILSSALSPSFSLALASI